MNTRLLNVRVASQLGPALVNLRSGEAKPPGKPLGMATKQPLIHPNPDRHAPSLAAVQTDSACSSSEDDGTPTRSVKLASLEPMATRKISDDDGRRRRVILSIYSDGRICVLWCCVCVVGVLCGCVLSHLICIASGRGVCVCVCCVCAVYVLCVGLFPEYQPRIQARNLRGRKVNILGKLLNVLNPFN